MTLTRGSETRATACLPGTAERLPGTAVRLPGAEAVAGGVRRTSPTMASWQ